MANLKEAAQIISAWTHQAGTMLPKSPEEVLSFIKKKEAVVLENGGSIVGFGAVTFDWPSGWKELGAVVVEPGHREKGLGHQVVQALIGLAKIKYPSSKLFALCNNKSLKLFLDAGGEVISGSELPEEVFEECVNCPKYNDAKRSGKLCCDTPVEIK